jgi:molybdopterin/thiamine biosynthesis adenylyltransferase
VIALTDLIHRQPSRDDFIDQSFGVLLPFRWPTVGSAESGGTLLARTSGRGHAILLVALTGIHDHEVDSTPDSGLLDAFPGSLRGWWVAAEEPQWSRGPEAVARGIEQAIMHRHRLAPKVLREPEPPLLAIAWASADLFRVGWLFMRRASDGTPAFGRNESVSAWSFEVRAPYASELAGARVTLVGAGSLGWPIAMGLARAGVRHFTLIDSDRLRPGNLARLGAQVAQVGERKIEALRDALFQVASEMEVVTQTGYLGRDLDATALLAGAPTLLIDAAADERTPAHINAAALALGVPALYAWMTGGVRNARIFRVVPGRTPCYACVAHAHPRSLVEERRSDAVEFTWIGANFNIDPIAAAAVRMAVRTLAQDAVDAKNPDHVVLRVGGPVPVATTLRFERDPRCRWCRR